MSEFYLQFKDLQHEALALGVPARDVNMAVNKADLRALIELAKPKPTKLETGNMSFKALQEMALSKGVPQRDVNLALEKADLVDMIQHAAGLDLDTDCVEVPNNMTATLDALDVDLRRVKRERRLQWRDAPEVIEVYKYADEGVEWEGEDDEGEYTGSLFYSREDEVNYIVVNKVAHVTCRRMRSTRVK